MDAFWVMFRNIAVFLLLAVPGFILVKTGILRKEDAGGLSKVLMYVGMPFLAFTGMVDKVTLDRETGLLIGLTALAGAVLTIAVFLLSAPLTRHEKNTETRAVMRFAATFPNNGFLGIPLAMAVFGDGKVLALLIVLNTVNNVLIYTLGSIVIGGKGKMDLKKAILNPVLIAFILGLVANLLNLKQYVPEISTYSGHFANIVAAVSMTVVGIQLGATSLRQIFGPKRLYYVSFLKLLLFPVLVVGLLLLVRLAAPGSIVDADVIMAFFMAFSMPTAGVASAMAIQYGSDVETAVSCTLGTTVLAVIVVPLLYWAATALV